MKISAFRGYRYDSSAVGDASCCLAPPYDVIDPAQQELLYERNPCNIVRVIKGKTQTDDDDDNNVYTRAAGSLGEWIAQGALKQDEQDSIYVYVQDFAAGGREYRRSGFVALGELSGYGQAVRPHEQTLSGPKADRLNLLKATKGQVGQVFMLYSDPAKTIDAILDRAQQSDELLSYTDGDEVTHRLFAITDPADVSAIVETMAPQEVFIADGHHRYETAVEYYAQTKNPAAARRMMTFVNIHNDGLVVLPTHRLIKNIDGFEASEFLGNVREQFDVARLDFADSVAKQAKRQVMLDALAAERLMDQNAFGMYFNDGAFYVATLRDSAAMNAAAGEHSDAWRKLDVAVLHSLVLEKYLGIDAAALAAERNIEYVKDFGPATAVAIDTVDSGQCQGLFFLNATPVAEVAAVAATGEKMPQKSTYFYPKVFSGLVINMVEHSHVRQTGQSLVGKEHE